MYQVCQRLLRSREVTCSLLSLIRKNQPSTLFLKVVVSNFRLKWSCSSSTAVFFKFAFSYGNLVLLGWMALETRTGLILILAS